MNKKSVLEMDNNEARNFFLSETSYCSLDLPEYYNFEPVLSKIHAILKSDGPLNYSCKKIRSLDNVNYTIMNNKDGKFAWRPLTIINPLLYVQLVMDITSYDNWNIIVDRMNFLRKINNIICCSVPFYSKDKKRNISNVLNWWNEFEQTSISMSLQYEYIACTDISNCYESIYTHSIPWAIYGKEEAKKNKNNHDLIGNIIDDRLMDMHNGQTNGIPQGSTLMDFLAEIVLASVDYELDGKLNSNNIHDYKILRYRDDYKIFANSDNTVNLILKFLSDILYDYNLKLNTSKTNVSTDIITNSLKSDKIDYYKNVEFNYSEVKNSKKKNISLQKYLLIIREISIKHNNSGTVKTCLMRINDEHLIKYNNRMENLEQIISILIDIMINNPKTYSICVIIISKILNVLSIRKRKILLNLIVNKFSKVANNDYLNIWLQRLIIMFSDKYIDSPICKIVNINNNVSIWNNSWTSYSINQHDIIDSNELNNLKPIIDDKVIKMSNYY